MEEFVKFTPTKKLFIDILTRDISIYDCILELVDNSVDAYTRNDIKDKREVKLKISKKDFEISDNCGGIKKEFLIEEVFRLGVSTFDRKHQTIGTYGIGLKRSLFKLGRKIIFETDDNKDYCKMEIDVENWIKNEKDWDIQLNTSKSSKSNLTGFTKIKIPVLRYEAEEIFTSEFMNDIKNKIGMHYTKYMQDDKLDFFLNEFKIAAYEFKIIRSNEIKPVKLKDKFEDVEIDILCWIQKGKEKRDYKKEIGITGWNIFMNDRLILSDNVAEDTGWVGEEPYLPKYHPIYNQFRGLVNLNSKDPSKLPWNTSKNGFNKENRVYIYLIDKMCKIARPIINYLSDKYNDKREEIESKEEALFDEIIVEDKKEDAIENAFKLEKFSESFTRPSVPPKEDPKFTTIKYKKPKKIVDIIKKRLDLDTNEEVGSATFDYYTKSEGIDDGK